MEFVVEDTGRSLDVDFRAVVGKPPSEFYRVVGLSPHTLQKRQADDSSLSESPEFKSVIKMVASASTSFSYSIEYMP